MLIIAMLVGSAALSGGITYTLTGRDLKGGHRVSVSLLSAILVGATSLFVPYLPALAFLVTTAAYLLVRRLLSPGLALAASALVLVGALGSAVLVMSTALNTM
ncbi:hypothetical protein [Actinomadura keratinilytica]|jgi:hypothetical protein|uniref:Uncharacterized protein n=1 Tax=Actinomadura keratinilytica TaxID=547461 RepID=A0ABP7Y6E8_9ACTN